MTPHTTVQPRKIWWLGAGFIVWCSAIAVLYALHAIGCVFDWPSTLLRWSLVVVFGLHMAATAWLWYRFAKTRPDPRQGPTGRFMHDVMLWSAIAAAAATLVTFAPPLLLSTCL